MCSREVRGRDPDARPGHLPRRAAATRRSAAATRASTGRPARTRATADAPMRVAFAADHAGAALKDELLRRLGAAGLGHELHRPRRRRLGSERRLPGLRRSGSAWRSATARPIAGILICGSGVGASVAANKMRGIRAAVCHDTYSAHQGVEHDDMNVLTLGARVIGPEPACECASRSSRATFSGEPRHHRRLDKVLAIEAAG